MINVMTDLETLGQRPGCSIISIGAVAFDPENLKLGSEFSIIVDRYSCLTNGLFEDTGTLNWWDRQSKDARKVLEESTNGKRSSLTGALDSFSDYLSQFDLDKVRVWGNGSDFDNAILSVAYSAVGRDLPWKFWNNRCYRTLKNLVDGPKIKRVGTHHNALYDAKSQALHAMELLRLIR